jgi:hypothetical protein
MSEALRKAAEAALAELEKVTRRTRATDIAEDTLRAALAEPDLNLQCKSTQARLAAQWGYVKAEPGQSEPETVMWLVRRYESPDYWIPFMHRPVDAYADPEREVKELVVKGAAPPRREPVPSDGWLQEGSLLYRVTNDRYAENRDEINVTMADGSHSPEARTRRAGELLDRIREARREPLSDEQIARAWSCGEHNASAATKRRITRAIEQAHGIGEKT